MSCEGSDVEWLWRCGVEKCFVTGDVANVAWVAPERQEGMSGRVLFVFAQWACFHQQS